MKKIQILSVLSLSLIMCVFTACVPDPGTDPDLPTIYVVPQGSPTYAAGTTVSYKIVLGSPNSELSTLTVKGLATYQPEPGSGVERTLPVDKWDFEKEEFENGTSSVTVYYDVVLKSTLIDGNQVFLEFKVFDDLDESATEEITITVGEDSTEPTGTEMTGETTATIYNFLQGPLPSGWDLLNDVGVSYSNNQGSVDIYNRTDVFNDSGYNNTYGFTPAYWTLNGTFMVRAGLDYTNATLEEVKDAYNSGTKLSTEAMTSTNEVFVARLRDGNTYAIIQTSNVGYTSNNQNDYLQFRYKKAK